MKKIKIAFYVIILLLSTYTLNSTIKAVITPYSTELDFSGANVVFDMAHGGYHATIEDFSPLANNLTHYKNNVLLNEVWSLPSNTDILFLTMPDNPFSISEMGDIFEWFNLGNKLLFACGDADYGGYYDASPINDLLSILGLQIYIASEQIWDDEVNDGASYRSAAYVYGTTEIASIVSQGCEAGIIVHGATSILGYNGTNFLDLRNNTLNNVEVLLSFGPDAYAEDSDLSAEETDLYSKSPVLGYYPAVVYEKVNVLAPNDSHVILAGEAIYTYYKFMYDQYTENGVYNGGIHYGQKYVNNILNYFINTEAPEPTPTPTPTPTEPSTISVDFQKPFIILSFIIALTLIVSKKKK